jgi:hypothetical protein
MTKAQQLIQSLSEVKSDKKIKIGKSNITYRYIDGYNGDMDDADIEHVRKLLADGYREGELVTSDPDDQTKDHRGWWERKR